MFASKTISAHLARGAIGIAALATAFSAANTHPWLALAALPLAFIAFRGCPTCWTLGLIQTVVARLQGKARSDACTDGCSALPSRNQRSSG
jgi:hypothetical protein